MHAVDMGCSTIVSQFVCDVRRTFVPTVRHGSWWTATRPASSRTCSCSPRQGADKTHRCGTSRLAPPRRKSERSVGRERACSGGGGLVKSEACWRIDRRELGRINFVGPGGKTALRFQGSRVQSHEDIEAGRATASSTPQVRGSSTNWRRLPTNPISKAGHSGEELRSNITHSNTTLLMWHIFNEERGACGN